MIETREYILEHVLEEASPQDLERRAIEIMGLTGNIYEAGYMLTNGDLLDFSGRRWGAWGSGTRHMDHNEINKIAYHPETDKYYKKYDTDRDKFMKKTGAVRLNIHKNGSFHIDMEKRPSYAQKKELRNMAQDTEPDFIIVDYKNKHHEFFDAWELTDFLEKL